MSPFETALHERIIDDMTGYFDRDSKTWAGDAFTDGARWVMEEYLPRLFGTLDG